MFLLVCLFLSWRIAFFRWRPCFGLTCALSLVGLLPVE